MNRTLKRPMFRMGGSSGTGITSGLDRPGYANGSPGITVGNRFFPFGEGDRVPQGAIDVISGFPNRMNAMKQPTVDQGTKTPTLGMNQNMTPSIKRLSTEERLMEALGKRDKGEDISKFLINFGLNLASATPRGGLLATAAEAAKGPSGDLFDAIDAEKDLERQIKLSAAQSDIGQEQAVELQMLKNLDEESKDAIEREILARMKDLGETREVASRIVLDKRAYGVLNEPGEVRRTNIETRTNQLIDQRVPPIIAEKQAEFLVDYNKIETANPDVNFDVNDPFWSRERSDYQEGTVYFDPEGNRYFRRDSGAEAVVENGMTIVPQGFVEVQIN